MWPIVRDAIADASPALRRQIRWIVGAWVAFVLLQMWDSRDGRGAAGVAEFLSAVLGVSGVALVGAAYTLQLTMEERARRVRPSAASAAVEVEQVLLALPSLGFAAGVALGAAALLMVLRALLGAEIVLAIAGGTIYGSMLVVAQRTVTRSARTLFNHAADQAAAAADARGKATAAQLAALQARMNPHFLFNALNTVASLLRSNPRAAEHVVVNLSDVLRQTLERSATTVGTVQEELDYVRKYVELEQERWGSRLRVEWDIADAARDCRLPPLVLQPLVENALRHGAGSRIEGGTIRITVRLADALIVRVDDDGGGFPARWTEGTGLGNLRERLQTLYGTDGTLEIDSDATGARVTVTVPAQCGC
jgi:signal transduction histidine kinase